MNRIKDSLIQHALIIFFYTALYTLFFSPVLFSGRLLAPGDGFVQSVPAFYAQRTLWTPLLYSGFPVAADPQAMTWYPIYLLFSLFPHSWNAFVISAYVLASCFAYGYVVTITGSRLAGFISGTVYGMSGFMMAHLGHTNMIHTAAWMPLLIWALERLRHELTARWFAVAILAIVSSILAGHPQISVYSMGLSSVYVFVMGLNAAVGRWRYYGLYLVAVAFSLGLAAIQLLPTAELVGLGLRKNINFAEFVSYSLPFNQAVQLIFPYLFGGYGLPYFGARNLTELTGYVGLLPPMLAVIGFVAYRPKSLAWFWTVVIPLAFFLTLGDSTPLAKLMYHLPLYNKFRVPARHFIEMALAVSVLSGLGVTTIIKQIASKGLIFRTVVGAAGIMLIGLFSIFLSSSKLQEVMKEKGLEGIKFLPWSNPAVGVPILIFILSAVFLVFWSKRSQSRFRQMLLITALVIDLGSFGWFYEWRYRSPGKYVLTPPASAQRYKPLLENMSQRMIPVRGVECSIDETCPNMSLMWGIPSASGYGPLLLSRISRLLSMAPNGAIGGRWYSLDNHSFDIMAIRYVFLPQGDSKLQSITQRGMLWTKNNLDVTLGSGCGVRYPDSIKFKLPASINATTIGIISSMGCSTNLPDNADVLHIIITDTHGKTHLLIMRAGRDTSEWAFDRSDVKPIIRHSKASIFESYPVKDVTGLFEGHRYITTLTFNNLVEVQNIELRWTGSSGSIVIHKISLFDKNTGRSYPIHADTITLGDSTRWRHVEDIGEASVYENLRAMPRAWLVTDVAHMKPEEILNAITSSKMPDGRTFDPSKVALVEEPFTFKTVSAGAGSSVQVVHISDTSVEVHTNSPSPAFLVLSDVYYPGWKATIDGVPTHIFQTNYVLRGVMVPAGGHMVRFEFRPKSFYIGAGISVLSLLFLLGIVLFKIRHR